MTRGLRGFAAGVLLCGLAAAGFALARGPDMNLQGFGSPAGGGFYSSIPAARYDENEETTRRIHKPKAAVAASGYGKAVCVRLCDGFFFPAGSTGGGDAACAAECPDAPTALYSMRDDRIEDAVSLAGVSYSKLPVAKRYLSGVDNTCTCRRDTVALRAKELLNDPTLRSGDVVMTANGFRVYQGGGYGPTADRDFVSLTKTTRLPNDERATLAAMERASAGSPAPAAPALLASRPKGRVTVDSETAAAR